MTEHLGRSGPRRAVLGVALLVLAACGGGGGTASSGVRGGPGVDIAGRTISVGAISGLSGPLAPIGRPLTRGQEVYFQALRDRGGIEGWNVNLIEKDTQYNPQLHVQQFNALLDRVALFAQSQGSGTTKAIQPLADQQRVLVAAATQASRWVTDPVMAVVGTTYAVEMANGLDYVLNTLGRKDAKIGIVYENDEYGKDGLRGYHKALDTYHFKSVSEASYASGDQDFSAPVTAMRTAGAEYVFLVASPSYTRKIVGTATAGGFMPHWVFEFPAWSQFLMTSDGTATGTPTPLFKVLPATTLLLSFEAQWGDGAAPGMRQFVADQRRYAPEQAPDVYFMYGYAEAEMVAAIIRKALDSGDLSREGLLNAKLHLGHLSLGGLLPDLDYSPSLGPVSRSTTVFAVDPGVPGFLRRVQSSFVSPAGAEVTFGP